MTTSNKPQRKAVFRFPAIVASAAWFSIAMLNGASVELQTGDILTGDIQSLDQNTLTLTSPVSKNPLQINSEAIKNIVFASPSKKDTHTERLTLTNGDILPCKVLALDDNQLKITTDYAGSFTVPRQHLQSLHFGIQNQKIVFHGTDAISDWSKHQGRWTKTNRTTYHCRGRGTLARKFILPENLRISYNLSWQGSPNFVFRFCGENDSDSSRQNTYEFSFNNVGMVIRRYTRQDAVLATIPLKPRSFTSRKFKIDFLVNRKSQRITLFIDGNMIDQPFPDQLGSPEGGYIIFNNRSSTGNISISDLLISESTHGEPERHRGTVGKEKHDTLLDSMGDQLTGNIHKINNPSGKQLLLDFTQLNSKDKIRIPEHRISSLHFAPADDNTKNQAAPFTGYIHGEDKLQISQPAIRGKHIHFNHPILGSVKLDSQILRQISRTPAGS